MELSTAVTPDSAAEMEIFSISESSIVTSMSSPAFTRSIVISVLPRSISGRSPMSSRNT